MKSRGQAITDDGFEKNVAEKMPKVKKEEFSPPHSEVEAQVLKEEPQEMSQEVGSLDQEIEKERIFEAPKIAAATEKNLDVSQLVEDLHTQILALGRTKRALEMDLTSHQKSIHQLAQDNKELRSQVEDLSREVQRLREVQAESLYLKEENVDALERIQEFQRELKTTRETLELATRERDAAQIRIHDLEAQIEQNEVLRVKSKLKEREASLFSEENRELRARLEEILAQNLDLEKKYTSMRKSFSEVRESLTLLRDSCKANYYNLSEIPE
jgi:chromosome segregation ATPase